MSFANLCNSMKPERNVNTVDEENGKASKMTSIIPLSPYI